MSKCRFAAALLALAMSSATLPARADNVCQNPSFRIAQGSPFKIRPQQGLEAQPTALAAGTYIARSGAQPGQGCGCDLALGLIGQSAPRKGFLALLHGNDDGTFNGTPDTLHSLNGLPVAIATGRFRTDSIVDGIVVVTSSPTGAGAGQAAVFVPDANGAYPPTPTATFSVGPNPVAITTGDFNGDGNLDAAVINKDDSSLTILFGTGTGSFAPNGTSVANLGGVPESVTSGKFSGNSGADDIAIGVLQNVSGSRQVGIVIVPGGSGFAPKPVMAVGQRNSFGSSITSANLSGSSDGAAGRRFRDLAITFTDRTPTGDAVGRIKVLLGRDTGGFGDINSAQSLELGPSLPRSIKVTDLDDDGVVDLVVSTFGDPASQTNGTVRFFQGRADNPIGFQTKIGWNPIPETTGIRPRALVAGRFGNHNPSQPIANMGLAAINAPDLNSIAVFQGNGAGAFTQPQLVTTPLTDDDRLFVPGDFHSPDGSSPLQDLVFVGKDNGRNVLRVLQANGAGGFALPDEMQPPPLAGNSPSVMVTGKFVPNTGTAAVLIDDTGGAGQQPLLKVFVAQGNGVLTPEAELPLPAGIGRPRAMVSGHFQGAADKLDLALITDTTAGTQPNGKITLLFNDGQGSFTVASSQLLGFSPVTLGTSNRMSSFGRSDLVIRDANTPRFQFLINIGSGNLRPAGGGNQGFFSGTGNSKSLLIGNVAHSGTEVMDDVISFDDTGKTLQIFVNNGRESFDLRTFNVGNDPHFAGVQPAYQLADFGSGTLGLAAPIIQGNGQVGLLLLQADGNGGFTPASGEVPLQQPLGIGTTTMKTDFIQSNGQVSGFFTMDIALKSVVVAQFRSGLHGNSKPDFALITKASASSRFVGNCFGDNTPPPAASPTRPDMVCPVPSRFNDCPPSQRPCFEGDCCFCNSSFVPARHRCPTSCSTPLGPPVPFHAVCNATTTFTPAISVFGNTCGD